MRYPIKLCLTICAVIVTLCLSPAVQAQDSPFTIDNVPNVVGVGIGIFPDYQGSNDYVVGAAPFARITMPGQERYLMLRATELSVNVLNHTWIRFGPVVNYRFGRDDDVDDDVVKDMDEIDGTIEAGAFLGAEFVNSESPRERFITSVQFLSDVGGEYNGYTVDISARYWYPVSLPVDISIGVGGTYANSNYMDTYFGISKQDSDRTGMSIFDGGSGMKGVRVLPAVVVHFSESWHLGIGARYERLLNDAKNSPLVDNHGSADQWVAGLGVAYSW